MTTETKAPEGVADGLNAAAEAVREWAKARQDEIFKDGEEAMRLLTEFGERAADRRSAVNALIHENEDDLKKTLEKIEERRWR